jgi:hypothetical protein
MFLDELFDLGILFSDCPCLWGVKERSWDCGGRPPKGKQLVDNAVLMEIESLRRPSLAALRQKFRALFQEETRSRHREHLFRQIAWCLQALVEGDLSERTRGRAHQIGRDGPCERSRLSSADHCGSPRNRHAVYSQSLQRKLTATVTATRTETCEQNGTNRHRRSR